MRPAVLLFRLRRVGWWLIALAALGCATTPGRAPSVAPPSAESGRSLPEPGLRQLFRVGYQGPGGGGSLRLALLETGPAAYQARATDAFGRALWSLEMASGRATFVDHRRRRFCVTEDELEIPELALGSLALDRLPVILGGEIPAARRRPGDDPDDFTDEEGRRWTGRREGVVVAAWTLWQDDRPLLWWQRLDQGGVLSHRDGAQFRWRRSVAEPLREAPPPLAIPADYLAAECVDLTALPADSG